MIITKEIEIIISPSNREYYIDIGYYRDIGDKIIIPVGLLPRGSHYEILCECDVCGKQKSVRYKNYLKYKITYGEYFCRKCSEPARKDSLLKSYGVEYPLQNIDIIKKYRNTVNSKDESLRYDIRNINKTRNLKNAIKSDDDKALKIIKDFEINKQKKSDT